MAAAAVLAVGIAVAGAAPAPAAAVVGDVADRLAAVDLALPDEEYDPDLRERREVLLGDQRQSQATYEELVSQLGAAEAQLAAAEQDLAAADQALAEEREVLAELTAVSVAAEQAASDASDAAAEAGRDEARAVRALRRVERELERETDTLTDRVLVWHKRGPGAVNSQLALMEAVAGAQSLAELAWADHTLGGQIEQAGDVVARVMVLHREQAAAHAEVARTAAAARSVHRQARQAQRQAQLGRTEQDRQVAVVEGLRQEQAQLTAQVAADRDEVAAGLEQLDEQLGELAGELIAVAREQGSRAVWPTVGRVSSGFGFRTDPILNERRLHTGLDVAAPAGTPIVAMWTGQVVHAGPRGGYGLMVAMDHGDGRSTLYGHMSRIDVQVGQFVRRGESLGAVGSTGVSTGPHLHLEVREHGAPRDPRPLLP